MDLNLTKSIDYKRKRLLQIFYAVEIAIALNFFLNIYNENIPQVIGMAVVFTLLLGVYWLIIHEKTTLAGNFLLLNASSLMLIYMWIFEGIRDEVLLIFPAIILFSLHIGSRIFALVIYITVCINIILIGYLNEYGYINNIQSGSTITSAIIIIIILSVIGYSVWLISADLIAANNALTKSKIELEYRVKVRTSELETSIRQLTNTQDQLIESEKMASLGRLVAGVAHEINTPLGISLTAASHLEVETTDFTQKFNNNQVSKNSLNNQLETTQASTKLILSNLTRAANLVQSFKEVAVDQSNEQGRKINLKNYLNEILSSLQPKIKNTGYTVELCCPDDLVIFSIPGAIAQIITNLFINAITHGFEKLNEGIIKLNVIEKTEKKELEIVFSDSGCGINEEHLLKIFEPFFTTKRSSGGTGLGMHIVYNLVSHSLQGSIHCTSKVGEGTQFTINLPNQRPETNH